MNAFNQNRQTIIANKVERAHTSFKRMKGLLGKTEMEKSYGLWISPCKSIHTFFMQFPIDVIFLSPDNQVVKLVHSIQPFRLSSWVGSAKSVLELASGAIEESGTQVGDQVIFRA